MSIATGVGSMPGTDAEGYAHAVRVVLDALPDLPFVPELPGRGATASMTGRGLAVVSGIGADLQPAGWRLTDAAGVDHRRARSLLLQDLDAFEEQAQGLDAGVKLQVAGPWTLAATVEKPRGDKVLSDFGARRDLAQALAEGLRDHVRDVRRRLPDVARLVVQVDEPALPAVLGARVPTASGFGRHRAVHPPEASEALEWVLGAVVAEGAEPWVHCCAAEAPLALLRGAGARGLSVDLSVVGAGGYDVLAEALEAGETLALGIVPSTDPAVAPTEKEATERVLRWLEMLGLDPDAAGGRLVLTPACGLACASAPYAQQALRLLRVTASNLSA